MARVSADERRRQLVAAAFRVIGRDGFAGVTTRRVCAEAGAPLAAFHYCFASKQELLAELTTQSMDALLSAQHEMALRNTVEATLRAELRAYWKTVEEDPNRESVLMALTQHALHDPTLDGVAQRQYKAYHATARVTLQRIATGFGVTWSMPVEDVARMLVVDRDSGAARTALDAFAAQLAALAR